MSKDRLRRPTHDQRQNDPSPNRRQIAPGKVTLTGALSSGGTGTLQRKAAAAGTGSAALSMRSAVVQRKPAADDTRAGSRPVEDWMLVALRPDLHQEPIQRQSSDVGYAHAEPVAAPSGGGRSMPGAVQAKMEHAFDTDFSAVRIHEGPQASAAGALAYTRGTDIHFAPGQYDPGSRRGQELLGHELAHVVQQGQGRVDATTQAKGLAVNDDPGLEREADEQGAKAARGERVAAGGSDHGPAGPVAGPVQMKKGDHDIDNDKGGRGNRGRKHESRNRDRRRENPSEKQVRKQEQRQDERQRGRQEQRQQLETTRREMLREVDEREAELQAKATECEWEPEPSSLSVYDVWYGDLRSGSGLEEISDLHGKLMLLLAQWEQEIEKAHELYELDQARDKLTSALKERAARYGELMDRAQSLKFSSQTSAKTESLWSWLGEPYNSIQDVRVRQGQIQAFDKLMTKLEAELNQRELTNKEFILALKDEAPRYEQLVHQVGPCAHLLGGRVNRLERLWRRLGQEYGTLGDIVHLQKSMTELEAAWENVRATVKQFVTDHGVPDEVKVGDGCGWHYINHAMTNWTNDWGALQAKGFGFEEGEATLFTQAIKEYASKQGTSTQGSGPAFQHDKPSTWDVLPLRFVNITEGDVTAAVDGAGILGNLRNCSLSGNGKKDSTIKPKTDLRLHAHLQTGTWGLAFIYVHLGGNRVQPVAYDVAYGRTSGNQYKWEHGATNYDSSANYQ